MTPARCDGCGLFAIVPLQFMNNAICGSCGGLMVSATETKPPEIGDTVYFKGTVVGIGCIFGDKGVRVHFEGHSPNAWMAVPEAAVVNVIKEGNNETK